MPILDNPKWERFAQLRAQGTTIDEAFVQAGYSRNRGNAARLNANESVVARVKELLGAHEERVSVTKSRVIEELARMGFANMVDYISTTSTGEAYVDLSRLTREQAAAITEITTETYMDGAGEDAREVKKVKLKLADKRGALAEINKMMGWIIQRSEVGAPGDFDEVEDAATLRKQLARLAEEAGIGAQAAAASRGAGPGRSKPH